MRDLEPEIKARCNALFESISGEAPSIFNKNWWTGKILDWAMQNDKFKIQMFRFVDVLPYLNTSESLIRHIKEYFGDKELELPAVLRLGITGTGIGGKLAGGLIAKTIRSNIENMAQQFIISEKTDEAVKAITKLRKKQFAFTLDILGEATVSKEEALLCQERYLTLLDTLGREQKDWKGLNSANEKDWGHEPIINVSVKPTGLYSQSNPADFAGTVKHICERITPIYRKVKDVGGFLCIDMEAYDYKDITLEVYRTLRGSEEFREYGHLGIALQAYLKETDDDIEELLRWAKNEKLPISIRLVKGAYWDYETVLAKQNGWHIPVYSIKAETDAAFERQARKILEAHEVCHFACGSHNVRTISAVMETAAALNVPEDRLEYQILYGMAEPIRNGLLNVAKRVRLYCPYGDLIPGMAYLVRRLLENTANESFLKQRFVDNADSAHLIENPVVLLARIREEKPSAPDSPPKKTVINNHPSIDFTTMKVQHDFADGIRRVRTMLGKTYPLIIGGQAVETDDLMDSVNPANPDEILGTICQAGTAEIDKAMAAAGAAFESWQDTPAEERAQYLFRAAEIARKDIYTLSAWQVLEVGKQWDQAYADVSEAIDFLNYYGHEMIRLGKPRLMGAVPGESNEYFYQPKGIAAIIAPWNFPLAISCGMAAAAIVAGNSVIYKPAGPSSVIGYALAEIFQKAGLPDGVFNYVPGRGRIIGDYLVEHKDISLIAFTGSMEIGQRILNRASIVQPGQKNLKKVICELGGKNGIIIDDDANLDGAVLEVVHSAFGFQGQKCSACSRVIVLESIYDRFVDRLLEACKSISIGPSEDPANYMGPVVDAAAQKSILGYADIGKKEGELLLEREVPSTGYYVPLTVIGNIRPEHRIAQEEIFGPVLAVMKAKDLDQALEWAVDTRFGLTGAIFSRSPSNLEKAKKVFRVGNLYINRGCTGALVERQPFGGFKMSGVGSKAGGPDYVLQFMDPRTITENTMRCGFTPDFA